MADLCARETERRRGVMMRGGCSGDGAVGFYIGADCEVKLLVVCLYACNAIRGREGKGRRKCVAD